MMASSADALGSPWLALGLPLITGPWLGTPRRYIEIYNERVKDLLNPMAGTDPPQSASDGVGWPLLMASDGL